MGLYRWFIEDTAAPILAAPHASAAIAVQRLMRLSLPGFTFGVDLVILVGHLRLCQHQTLDEAHQTLLERLAPFALPDLAA